MVTKTALILLFLAMPVMAQQSAVFEEEFFDAISVNAVDSMAADVWRKQDTLWSSVGTIRDTTRYYVFDVKERTKCDTFSVTAPCPDLSYAEQGMSCLMYHYQTVIECDDTTWAPKIQIWLTPDQLYSLLDMIKERSVDSATSWNEVKFYKTRILRE